MVACNPHEAILNDWLGEDHVGLCILYYLAIVSIVMTIWKWLLVQTIFDGYLLIEHFITFHDTHILDVANVGSIGVKKKKNSVHKTKRNVIDSKGSISRIEKMLLEESMCNVGVEKCCTMNCCQHFFREKMLLK